VRFIRDRTLTKYIIVTIPEALGVMLTKRIIKDFKEHGLYVDSIVINHVIEQEDCEFHKRRKEMQQQYINIIRDQYNNMNIVELYLMPYEIKGLERIERISQALLSTRSH